MKPFSVDFYYIDSAVFIKKRSEQTFLKTVVFNLNQKRDIITWVDDIREAKRFNSIDEIIEWIIVNDYEKYFSNNYSRDKKDIIKNGKLISSVYGTERRETLGMAWGIRKKK